MALRVQAKQAHLEAEAFSPNTPHGACPECHGLRRVHTTIGRSMVPDPSKTVRERAVAGWPPARQDQNLGDILVSLGSDVDRSWRELSRQDRDLFTEEQPRCRCIPRSGSRSTRSARTARSATASASSGSSLSVTFRPRAGRVPERRCRCADVFHGARHPRRSHHAHPRLSLRALRHPRRGHGAAAALNRGRRESWVALARARSLRVRHPEVPS
jgi:hypothetical protein